MKCKVSQKVYTKVYFHWLLIPILILKIYNNNIQSVNSKNDKYLNSYSNKDFRTSPYMSNRFTLMPETASWLIAKCTYNINNNISLLIHVKYVRFQQSIQAKIDETHVGCNVLFKPTIIHEKFLSIKLNTQLVSSSCIMT